MEIEDDYSKKAKIVISWKKITGAALIGIPISFIIFFMIEIYKAFGPLPFLVGIMGGSMIAIGYFLLKKG